MKIAVEIELPDDEAKKLDELIEDRTLDREKFLKKLLTDGIRGTLKKREIALGRITRAKAMKET
jgi:predicted transcriptional regulator